jgi:hypothetical protein
MDNELNDIEYMIGSDLISIYQVFTKMKCIIQNYQSKLDESIALNEELVKRIDELMFYQTHLDECNCLGCKQDRKEIQQYQGRINKLKD